MQVHASVRSVIFVCLAGLVLAPSLALAQDEAGIAGSVYDNTGGVLPGVTIEARSPALIEQVRTVFTDGAGIYRITNLPSGTYSVTFTLPGFSNVLREGVVLRGAFVAEVDASMAVGGVEETVTVAGVAPLVDVRTTRQQSVMPAERVNVLPGAAGITSAAAYVPGAVLGGGYNNLPSLHGSDPLDGQPAIDGIKTGGQLQGRNEWGAGVGGVTNEAMVTEVVFDTSSQSAEFAQSGVRTNVVPKAGGNEYSYNLFLTGTQGRFEWDNQSQDLKDRGFEFAPIDYSYSFNPAAGGPIIRDKLWFFASMIENRSQRFILDQFWDLNEPSTPDSVTEDDLRAFSWSKRGNYNVRITHQVTQRNKLTWSYFQEPKSSIAAFNTSGLRIGPEAWYRFNGNPTFMATGRWTAPVTNRLLLEVHGSFMQADVNTFPAEHGEFRMSKQDLAQGTEYNSSFQNHHNHDFHRRINASLSYVTGSHNFKAGINFANNRTALAYSPPGEIFKGYFFNGTPLGVLVAGNSQQRQGIIMDCDCGIYLQDAWTMDRLTLNAGFRYDWFQNSVPGGTREAGWFAPEVTLPDPVVENIPNWRNYNARVGGAFDLFGDGSTAVKASMGRYVANEGTGVTQGFNPIYPYGQLDWRSWSDLNGDDTALNPDGTPQLDEIGPSNNPNYGTSIIQTQYDPDARRGTNWEYSAGVERQLGPGWALSLMWHRRSYGNFRWTDNLNNSADDYELAGNWTGPTDPDLPESARGVVVPIYNLKRDATIVTGNNLLTTATENWRTWSGFEVIIDGELPRGGFMTGSITAGTSTNHFCHSAIHANPNRLRHCETKTPYRPMGKLSGALPLPFDTMISGLVTVFPGSRISASYAINLDDFPGLYQGENVDPTLTVNLIEPNTVFEPYTTVMRLRFSKVFTIGDIRSRVYMDTTNIMNRARVTRRSRFFGGGGIKNPNFLRIDAIEPGRRLSFGVQMYF